MQTEITILTSELSEMHPAYEQGATSNEFHHIIDRKNSKRIATITQKNGEWCEVHGSRDFQLKYDSSRFPTRASCLTYVLGLRKMQYNETSEDEEDSTSIIIRKTKKSQRNEFGFLISSKVHLFCEQLAAAGSQGITMDDARNAEWNTGKASFFGAMKKLINDGKAIKKGKRMYLLSAIGEKSLSPIKPKSKPQPVAVPVKAKPMPVAIKRKPRLVAV